MSLLVCIMRGGLDLVQAPDKSLPWRGYCVPYFNKLVASSLLAFALSGTKVQMEGEVVSVYFLLQNHTTPV